jgi:hypothetical protein
MMGVFLGTGTRGNMKSREHQHLAKTMLEVLDALTMTLPWFAGGGASGGVNGSAGGEAGGEADDEAGGEAGGRAVGGNEVILGEGAVVNEDHLAGSVRTWNPSARLKNYALWSVEHGLSDGPTLEEVLKRPDLDLWHEAMQEEIQAMLTQGAGAG